jgi:hypothetical protein
MTLLLQDVGGRGVAGRPAVGGAIEAHHGLTSDLPSERIVPLGEAGELLLVAL